MKQPRCVVCNARTKFGDTCDSLCTRAKKYGRERGKQCEVELRGWANRPIVVDSLTSPSRAFEQNKQDMIEELEYNRPYIYEPA